MTLRTAPLLRSLFTALALTHMAFAADAPLPPEMRAQLIASLEKTRAEADEALAKDPSSLKWLTWRGKTNNSPA